MNDKNKEKLWKTIQQAGDSLSGKLPNHPNHPRGRNPYAHIALCIKEKFKVSYKDIPNEKFNDVLEFINFLKNNPK
tara:strand:- start:37 stop:264 length:228 start_codon:yes stop_codon:yes gene_type:complete